MGRNVSFSCIKKERRRIPSGSAFNGPSGHLRRVCTARTVIISYPVSRALIFCYFLSGLIPPLFRLFLSYSNILRGMGRGPMKSLPVGQAYPCSKMPVRSLKGAGRAYTLFVFPDALETRKVKDRLAVPADALGLVCHLDGSADDLVGICKELPAHLPGHGPGAYVERRPLIIA